MYKKILNKQDQLFIIKTITDPLVTKLEKDLQAIIYEYNQMLAETLYQKEIEMLFHSKDFGSITDILKVMPGIKQLPVKEPYLPISNKHLSFRGIPVPLVDFDGKKYNMQNGGFIRGLLTPHVITLKNVFPNFVVTTGEKFDNVLTKKVLAHLDKEVKKVRGQTDSLINDYTESFNSVSNMIQSTKKSAELLELFPNISAFLPKIPNTQTTVMVSKKEVDRVNTILKTGVKV